MEQVRSASPKAYKRTAALDSTMFYMGNVMSFLARGEDTGGRFALMEAQAKPGNEPPPHLHEWEHETFYVLEGAMEVYCEDKVLMAHPGEVVFIPQGKPHAFYIRSPHIRILILVQAVGDRAVGLDRYFTQMAEPATSMNLPTEAVTYLMDDPSHAIHLGEANGIRFLSPEETAKELPHYPGFGANLEKIGQ
ncbi:MAG: cupin domain-containing protein [Chroococcidiopsis sp.]